MAAREHHPAAEGLTMHRLTRRPTRTRAMNPARAGWLHVGLTGFGQESTHAANKEEAAVIGDGPRFSVFVNREIVVCP